MSYKGDQNTYMSQMIALNSIIREIKLRNLKLEKNRMISNIFIH